MENEFIMKEMSKKAIRKEPVTTVTFFVVESHRAVGYKSNPNNHMVFIDGKFAIGE